MNTDSIVLQEEIDNYEPTSEEIEEYAEYLGILEKEYYWIARDGLKASLPSGWKPCQMVQTQQIYYFNFETGESRWDHPCDSHYRQLYLTHKARMQNQQVTINPITEQEEEQDSSASERGFTYQTLESGQKSQRVTSKYLTSARKSALDYDNGLAQQLEQVNEQTALMRSKLEQRLSDSSSSASSLKKTIRSEENQLVPTEQSIQPRGMLEIEREHELAIQQMEKCFEMEKAAILERIALDLQRIIEKENRQFEADLQSFQLIWEKQFQVPSMSLLEQDSYRRQAKFEVQQEYNSVQDEQQRKSAELIQDIAKKNKVAHTQLIAQKKAEHAQKIQQLQAARATQTVNRPHSESQLGIATKEIQQTSAKQMEAVYGPIEARISNLIKQKKEIEEKILFGGELRVRGIETMDAELHDQITVKEIAVDLLTSKRNQLSSDITEKQLQIEQQQQTLKKRRSRSSVIQVKQRINVAKESNELANQLEMLLEDRKKFLENQHEQFIRKDATGRQSELTLNILQLLDEKIENVKKAISKQEQEGKGNQIIEGFSKIM